MSAKFINWIVVVALLVFLAVGNLVIALRANERGNLQWESHACGTVTCVADFLNRLPDERAAEAKVITINSQRSFMGVLSDPYYVYYRK
jgi:hypothetical protein